MRKKLEENYTELENETIEAMARSHFTAREFRVMLAVLRLTNGFHLTENRIGINYLCQLTGMPRQHIWESLKTLQERQVLARDSKGLIAWHGPTLWKLVTPISDNNATQIPPEMSPPGVTEKAVFGDKNVTDLVTSTSPPREPPKENLLKKTLKKTPSGGLRKKRNPDPNPVFSEIFQEMRDYLHYPEKTPEDPIPSYGKEAQAIKRMLTRGFTREDILACWKGKVSQRGGEFVSMTWVNEDISRRKDSYGAARGQRLREPGRHPQQAQPPVRSVTEEDLESGRASWDGRTVTWADEERDKAGGSALPDLP